MAVIILILIMIGIVKALIVTVMREDMVITVLVVPV